MRSGIRSKSFSAPCRVGACTCAMSRMCRSRMSGFVCAVPTPGQDSMRRIHHACENSAANSWTRASGSKGQMIHRMLWMALLAAVVAPLHAEKTECCKTIDETWADIDPRAGALDIEVL